jgi:hypothetical protein
MITLINKIIVNSKYVNFPIKITSETTKITYLIVKIDNNSIFYKEKFRDTYSCVRDSLLNYWNKPFLIQLNKLLKELIQQGNIWED